ncbi:MAG: hypothetical protein NTV72_00130 [Candidatus Taylorbacteria bacterium]|nr:hypothetical protein [Candidatus Taylorbacteria bacterium]
MNNIDHIFIGDNYNLFNEIYPFYVALDEDEKVFYTDDIVTEEFKGKCNIKNLLTHQPKNKKAIIYASISKHIIENMICDKYTHVKLVRMFHGITGPWSTILDKSFVWDVVIESSELGADNWKERRPEQKVEIIGWPKGESFISNNNIFDTKIDQNAVLVEIHWAKKYSGFDEYYKILNLSGYRLTFLLHPVLFSNINHLLERKLSPEVAMEITTFAKEKYETAIPSLGVLPYMLGKSIMIGALSSTSLEWLLFDKPILFLTDPSSLNFGASIKGKSLPELIQQTLQNEPREYKARRSELKRKLMSHFDNSFKARFNNLVNELKRQL